VVFAFALRLASTSFHFGVIANVRIIQARKRPQAVKIYPRASNGTRLVHYFVHEMDPSSGKWHLVRTSG
jgi:hypothetical protein